MKLSKKIVTICILVFCFLSGHLAYQYVQETSPKVPVKGGTIVEGILWKLNYLPYTSKKPLDEYYQNLIFNGCVKSVISWENASYDNNLCDVTTKDYKNYYVTVSKDFFWIDDITFSIEDVLFTYQTILKENVRKIPDLNTYSKIEITQTSDTTLKISFPKQSRDNILLFTNPLLPKHVLQDKTLDYYLKTFAKQPVYVGCATLDLVKSQNQNFIVDVTNCKELYPKIIQLRSFENETEAIRYLQDDDSIIDFMSVDSAKEKAFATALVNYTGMFAPSSTLYTLFFNINTVSEGLRKNFSQSLSLQNFSNLLYHKTIFSFAAQSWINLRETFANQTVWSSWWVSWSLAASFPFLPKNIWIFWKGKYKEYYLDELRDKYLIQFKFDTKYDKITIAANGPYEFTPDSYDAENKTCAYNLSLQYKNIKKWINTYIVYGYLNGKQIKLLTMKVHYGIKPQVTPIITKKTNYTIIYLDEPNSSSLVNELKQFTKDEWIDAYITRSSYTNFTEFEWKLSSKSYDMAILPLELGNKKDLSALFSDNIVLNPSQYTNDRIIQLLQNFNNGNKSTVNEILSIYQKVYPFTMLWSLKQKLFVKSIYETKLHGDYNSHNFRTRFINELKTYETIVVDKSELLKAESIINFIKSKL
jgi:hypothetical protein